uniref:dITP/XTP pyrophosphatase n=2 Tax=Candidatus Bipolaricaulota TaxID=67810 RepID=H5S9Y8_9BACT|nr:nucleoside-triphosphatase [uncultured Acetothermia bacterium]BAL59242.1 nucleoside-triphosphatase [Candidatus Acetothermum autotrophicum]
MILLLGTKNLNKIREITEILSDLRDVRLLTCRECSFSDVLEDGRTFEENARKKAREICAETGLPVLAEDSGLEVPALGGAPGVQSARFAGPHKDDRANIEKLLDVMRNIGDRRAWFRCVAVLAFPDGQECVSEGILEGKIAHAPAGAWGFGYDPIFIPDGFSSTLAELEPQMKNKISHRRRALEGIKAYIRAWESKPRR